MLSASVSTTNSMASQLAAKLKELATAFFESNKVAKGSQSSRLAVDASKEFLEEFYQSIEGVHDELEVIPATTSTPDSNKDTPAQTDSIEQEISEEREEEQFEDIPHDTAEAEPQARLTAYYEAARAITGDSATVTVTTSRTGKGVHTRWSYPELSDASPHGIPQQSLEATGSEGRSNSANSSEPAPAERTDDTLAGEETNGHLQPLTPKKDEKNLVIVIPASKKRSQGDESGANKPASSPSDQKRAAETTALLPTNTPTSASPSIMQSTTPVPVSGKRTREDENDDGHPDSPPSNRKRISNSAGLVRKNPHSSSQPSRKRVSSSTSRSNRYPPTPSTPSTITESHVVFERPFNHHAILPRSHPGAPQREHAFYHKSHYEIAWVPEFGDYNRPPKTVAEALPDRSRPIETPPTPESVSSSAPPSPKKRAREEDETPSSPSSPKKRSRKERDESQSDDDRRKKSKSPPKTVPTASTAES